VTTLRGSKNSRTTFWNIDDWEEHVLAHRPDGSSRGSSNLLQSSLVLNRPANLMEEASLDRIMRAAAARLLNTALLFLAGECRAL
jgi:hypothetical protein